MILCIIKITGVILAHLAFLGEHLPELDAWPFEAWLSLASAGVRIVRCVLARSIFVSDQRVGRERDRLKRGGSPNIYYTI